MLNIKNLFFTYKARKKEKPIFENLNTSFIPGLNIILGPNGAGKSTLLKSIFGLLDYDGSIWYGKQDLGSMKNEEKTKFMSYLPQMDVDRSMLTVLEMVLLGRLPDLGRHIGDEDLDKVMETLKSLNISHLAPRRFNELSGGQKKIVFIAQTLVREPEIILLDEPVNSLDLQKQLELCYLLRNLVKDKKISIIVVLHDINLAARFAHHIVVFNKRGELYSSGSPQKVITEEMIREVYGVIARVNYDDKNTPLISAIKSTSNMDDHMDKGGDDSDIPLSS